MKTFKITYGGFASRFKHLDARVEAESELSGRNSDGQWEIYTVDEDSIINTRNILEL